MDISEIDLLAVEKAFAYGERVGRTSKQKHSHAIAYLEGYKDNGRKEQVGKLVDEITKALRTL